MYGIDLFIVGASIAVVIVAVMIHYEASATLTRITDRRSHMAQRPRILLLIFGLGSIIGPLVAGIAMGRLGETGLFMTSLGAHVLLVVFTLVRMKMRAAVREAEKTAFMATPPTRVMTPETAAMATEDLDSQDLGPTITQA